MIVLLSILFVTAIHYFFSDDSALPRCWRVSFLLALSVVPSTVATTEAFERKPNVIVFLSDDQGWGDFSFQGNKNLQTPNIDSLAKNGAILERFYVSPVCAPTRAEFLTGRYHPRGGAMGVSEGKERLDLDEITLADRFREAGYATACFGKWHNGTQMPYHPNGRGFDEFYGFCSGHWGDYFSPPLDHNGEAVLGNGYVTDDFTQHALSFMDKHKSQPFFCYIAYNTPHSPMQVPDQYFDRLKSRSLTMRHEGRPAEKEDPAMTVAALAMVENIDDNVGRIIERLSKLGITDDTIIVYFNDNGPNSFRWNGGFKGRKGSVDEGGVRSPCLIQWPKHIQSSLRLRQLSGAVDLTPTLCGLAGIAIDPGVSMDGIDWSKHLLGKSSEPIERSLFSHWAGKVSMRKGEFLLDPDGELFNVLADPAQRQRLTDSEPERAKAMKQAVDTWKVEVLKPAIATARPFTVGHPSRARTELPARDGKATGSTVKRSAAAPNCSYFTNWKSLDDEITWGVDILSSGTYQVVLQYAAPASSLGTKLELQCAGKSLPFTLDVAHEVVAYGAENDRVPRQGESLMKDFKRWSVGEVALPQGKTTLRLKQTELHGADGLELRAIELVRRP